MLKDIIIITSQFRIAEIEKVNPSASLYHIIPSATVQADDIDNNNNYQSFAAQPVMINEVELNPSGADTGQEKVELYNPSDSPVDGGGWTLSSSGGAKDAIVTISEGLVIPPRATS